MHPSLCQKTLSLPLCDLYTADHYRKCDFPVCFTNRLATFHPRSCFLRMISCRIWERGEFRTYTLHFIHHCQLRYIYKTFVFVVFSLSWNLIKRKTSWKFPGSAKRPKSVMLPKGSTLQVKRMKRKNQCFAHLLFLLFFFFCFEGNLCKKMWP